MIQGMQLWTTSPFRKDLAGKQVQKRNCFEVIYAGVSYARFPPLCVIFSLKIYIYVSLSDGVTQAELLLEFFNKKVNQTTFLRYPYSDRDLLLQSIERVSLMTNL